MSEFTQDRQNVRSLSLADSMSQYAGGASFPAANYANSMIDPPGTTLGVGLTFKLDGRSGSSFKVKVFAQHSQPLGGGLTARAGIGATYHSNFYGTGKKGTELHSSLAMDYEKGKFKSTLGTNRFDGFGGLSEFSQRTGFLKAQYDDVGLSYENDGTPFQYIGLGDGDDKFRSAAASIFVGDFSLDMNLFTGRRDKLSFKMEEEEDKDLGVKNGIPEGTGWYGEEYKQGFVKEHGPRYRLGNLTLNHKGLGLGLDSEWIRHTFQNRFAHGFVQKQRQFEMLSGDWQPVFKYTNMPYGPRDTHWGY